MKIFIKIGTGRRHKIPAPIPLMKFILGLSGFGTFVAKRIVKEEHRQYIECIDFKALGKSLDVLKAYKGLKLVDVKTGDGTEVVIRI